MANQCKLTVFFDQQFYRGVFERQSEQGYQVARVTFGTQPPSPILLMQFINRSWPRLRWATTETADDSLEYHHRIKQRQRQARRELNRQGSSQRATKLLKLTHQHNLVLKKQRRQQQRQQHATIVRSKRLAKRQAKRRGH
ncbi:YjdF family protein [Lactiplantibacillus daowaiensis]|uniref:YjdF family protein n=1 Tax=Lactiplantibacillus daowaiensis TaxID=2559918 RepID=A0ABW1S2M3_9LACO